MEVRTRFAPSPTGYLHIGGLRTALYAYLFAKKNGGRFILRIEDTDQDRKVDDACEIIYRTLKATGILYDEGPDVGGEFGPYVQSERRELYRKYAEKLVELGAAYYCFCTKERLEGLRSECEKKGEVFKYDKHCMSLSTEEVREKIEAGEPYVIRQNIPREGESAYEDAVYGWVRVPMSDMEDNILLKSDGMPTYNLANVIDDHLMGITHVIRGTEYLSSTPKYNLLYDALGWARPTYIHLPPVMKDKHAKLSKRNGDASFEDFVNKGYLKEAIVNYIALLGWNPGDNREIFTLEELTEAFDLKGLSKSPAIFDVEKLTWMNGEYIRGMSMEEFIGYAKPYMDEVLGEGRFDREILARAIQPRLETFCQIADKVRFLVEMPEYGMELYFHKKMKATPATALPCLEKAYEVLSALKDYSETALHDVLLKAVEEMGVKNGQFLWPLRVAITGTPVTPGGAIEVAALLGKEETLKRLSFSIEKLKEDLKNSRE